MPLFRNALFLSAAILLPFFVEAQYATIDGHDCFRNIDGMMQSMFDLATSHPELVTITDIGDSYIKDSGSGRPDGFNDFPDGGYDIYVMNVTASDSMRQSSEKGKTFIVSGVHAREYAPPELNMRYVEYLISGYGENADITWLLRRTELHFIIYVNPDGRFIAENYPDLRWRRNLNPNDDECDFDDIGTDLNRNWDFLWGDSDGSSSDECSNTYHGQSPFSEPEVRAVNAYASALFPEGQRRVDPENNLDVKVPEDSMGVFIDIHSSGGYVYYSWHHKEDPSPDDDALQALGRKLSYFNDYKLWAPGFKDFVYPVSGGAADYMYGVFSVASLGFELGEEFYEDCDLFIDEIVPINIPALMYASKISTMPFSLIKGPDVLELEILSDDAQDGDMKATVVASDSRMVNGEHFTGDQGVAKVQFYLDVHPDDYSESDVTWEVLPTETDDSQSFELPLKGVSSGQHILYVQAVDNEGFLGPVSSSFFDVERVETANPSSTPTGQPTPAPTSAPSKNPTNAPSKQPTTSPSSAPTTSKPTIQPTTSPTSAPSSSPTFAPSRDPTKAPSNQPTTSPSDAPTTSNPTTQPTMNPTNAPSTSPSRAPSNFPTKVPTSSNLATPATLPSPSSDTSPAAHVYSSFGIALASAFTLVYIGI